MNRLKSDDPEIKLKMILDRCIINGECLEWPGTYFVTKGNLMKTYPLIIWRRKQWRGNRLVLTLSKGDAARNLFALHSCDNKRCLNPDHLRWGTPLENVIDMKIRGRRKCDKITHCPSGHPYRGKNLYFSKENHRRCRTCRWYEHHDLPIGPLVPIKYRDILVNE
jgi:hypothetical protein